MSTLASLIPQKIRRAARNVKSRVDVHREYAADRRRYLANMMPDDRAIDTRLRGRNLEAQITKDYHRIEKGLALRNPRQPFGYEVKTRLEMLLPFAEPGQEYAEHARSALSALDEWNSEGTIAEDISPRRIPDVASRNAAPEDFFRSRHSVRDFTPAPITKDLLVRAVSLALCSPSVCNRQSWRVHFFHGSEATEVLAFQNGSAGFRETVPTIAVVTVDTRAFAGAKERNQAWIEGGIFSMSLVWALHALGLDSCMLNMSVPTEKADALRRRVDASDAELVIMMVAIGQAREGHRRARSPRRDVDDVVMRF